MFNLIHKKYLFKNKNEYLNYSNLFIEEKYKEYLSYIFISNNYKEEYFYNNFSYIENRLNKLEEEIDIYKIKDPILLDSKLEFVVKDMIEIILSDIIDNYLNSNISILELLLKYNQSIEYLKNNYTYNKILESIKDNNLKLINSINKLDIDLNSNIKLDRPFFNNILGYDEVEFDTLKSFLDSNLFESILRLIFVSDTINKVIESRG